MTPVWFGLQYPSLGDLEGYAADLGVGLGYADVPIGLFLPDVMGQQVIILPEEASPLERMWHLAHELGHAVQHSGPKGKRSHGKEEAQANRWSACALIPEARILLHQNACLDAFIGALSAHYEDLPLEDCPARRLAGEIAKHRIHALKVSPKEESCA